MTKLFNKKIILLVISALVVVVLAVGHGLTSKQVIVLKEKKPTVLTLAQVVSQTPAPRKVSSAGQKTIKAVGSYQFATAKVGDVQDAVSLATSKGQIGITTLDNRDLGVVNPSVAVIKGSQTIYKDIYSGVDLIYTTSKDKVLEEYELKTPKTVSEIVQQLDISGLDYQKQVDGSILLFKKDTGEFAFAIPRPVMYERNAIRQRSYGLHYEILQQNGLTYLAKVIDPAGKEWLAKSNYPVVIDATILLTLFSYESYPIVDGTWQIRLDTVGQGDLTISPASSLALTCGGNLLTLEKVADSLIARDFSCSDLALVTTQLGTALTFSYGNYATTVESPTVSGKPVFLAASVTPATPKVGDTLTIKAEITDVAGVSEVKATLGNDQSPQEVPLNLVSGTATHGTYQGQWTVTNTVFKQYPATITATDTNAVSNRTQLTFFDAYTCLGGGDHGGAAWDPSTDCPSGFAGTHTNIGTLNVTGTATVQAYDGTNATYGYATISATTVNITGTLTAGGKGYPGGIWANGSGPGAGTQGSGRGGGAGYGGNGAYGSSGGTGGSTYGSFLSPTSLGSGGANEISSGYGNGGGAIKINASGTVTISGSITANGNNGSWDGWGAGGSGGSIYITGSTVNASGGTITANGGTGDCCSGRGGGGRIAIKYATSYTVPTTLTANYGSNGGSGTAENGTVVVLDTTNNDLYVPTSQTWRDSPTLEGQTYTYHSVTIQNSSTLTLDQLYGRTTNNTGITFNVTSFTVGSGSYISLNGEGYAAGGAGGNGSGPGAGTSGSGRGGGAGYGGNGGDGTSGGAGGPTYGSFLNPTSLGSGGANSGGAGGGAIKINASGTVTISGSITANGSDGDNGGWGGGGSGGSIYITGSTVNASGGTITANGGTGDCCSGRGGGGRIAIKYATSYTVPTTLTANYGSSGLTGADYGTLVVLDTTNNDLYINTSQTWRADPALEGQTFTYHNITVQNNSTLTLRGYNTTNSDGVGQSFYVTNFNITSGSAISANGQGYAGGGTAVSGSGPGGGHGSASRGGGGGYGGVGGNGVDGTLGGVAYGSSAAPLDLGSGGGGGAVGNGGNGGGAVRIVAKNTLTVSGSLTTNGSNSTSSDNSGGGAGGSLYLSVGTLSGGGTISATGGSDGCCAGKAGGGRIAIYYSSANNWTGSALTSIVATAYGSTGYGSPGYGSVVLAPGNIPAFSALSQFQSDCSTPVSVGGLVAGTSGCLGATFSDADNPDTEKLEFEYEPLGMAFTGIPGATVSGIAMSGSPVSQTKVISSLVLGTSYHWQAKVTDSFGFTTDWVSYPQPTPNSESAADFTALVPAPTNLVSTYVSDSETDLSWTNNAGGLADTNYIERSDNGGAFSQIGTTAAANSTYADKTTSAGYHYLYRVRAGQGANYSLYATATYPIYTSPGFGKGVYLTKLGRLFTRSDGMAQVDVWKNVQSDSADRTSPDLNYSVSSPSAGPVFPSAPTFNSLTVSEGNSLADGNSDVIYVGTANGLVAIHENALTPALGAVKYYTKDYISELMVGDIRGMWPLDSRYGSGLSDASSKAQTLTNNGAVTFAGGVRGQAASFNGSSQYLSIADNANMSVTGDLTLGAWFKTTSASTAQVIVAKNGSYGLSLTAAGKVQAQVIGATTGTRLGATTIDTNWHHVVAVYSASAQTLNLYLDGKLDNGNLSGTVPAAITDSAGPFDIGADNGGTLFSGSIDEVFVTATALSGGQISPIYEAGYHALQNHTSSSIAGITGAGDYQKLLGGGALGATVNNVGAVGVDGRNQFIYVGTNDTSGNTGGVSVVGVLSDSVTDLYSTTNTAKKDDQNIGFSANDAIALSVSGSLNPAYRSTTDTNNSGGIFSLVGTNDVATRVWIEGQSISLTDALASANQGAGGSVLRVTSPLGSPSFPNGEYQLTPAFEVNAAGVVSQNYLGADTSTTAFSLTDSTLTTGTLMSLSSTANKVLAISQTGITGTVYGAYINSVGTGSANVALFASASGAVNNYAAVFASGNVGIGTTAPNLGLLDLRSNLGTIPAASISAQSAYAAFLVDNSTGDLITASASGLSRFVVTQAGNVLPGTTNGAENIGSTTNYWNTIYANNIISGSSGTSGFWQRNSGVIAPTAITDSLIVGGTATGAGQIQLYGVNALNPVASISGRSAVAALMVDNTVGDLFTASSSGQTRFVITQNGNVGIGTTSPSKTFQVGTTLYVDNSSGQVGINTTPTSTHKLDVNATGTAVYAAFGDINGSGPLLYYGSDGSVPYINSRNNQGLAFYTNNSEKLRIDTSGNVGIGTSSPLARFQVFGNSTTQVASVSASTGMVGFVVDNAVGDLLAASSSGMSRFVVTQNGNVGIGTTSPGYTVDVAGDVNITGTYRINGTPITGGGIGGSGTQNYIPIFSAGTTLGNSVIYQTGGNVGIGTTVPESLLDVHGNDIYVDTSDFVAGASGSRLWMGQGGRTGNTYSEIFAKSVGGNALSDLVLQYGGGNVGIGTNSPGYTVDVAGDVNITGTYRINGTPITGGGIGGSGTQNYIPIFSAGTTLGNSVIYQTGGNVGIGTTSLGFTFVVNGTVSGTGFYVTDLGLGSLNLCKSDAGATAWLTRCNGNDVAEFIPGDNVEPGDVVTSSILSDGTLTQEQMKAVGNVQVEKATVPYDQKITGVISTNGVASESIFPTSKDVRLALAGRVPTKVSLINGPIKRGDPITASEIPGVGMKATKAGQIVARALEDFDATSATQSALLVGGKWTITNTPCGAGESNCYNVGKVVALISVSYFDPDSSDSANSLFGGNVGIGTSSPRSALDVVGSSPSTSPAFIENLVTTSASTGLVIKMDATTNNGTTHYLNFLDLNGRVIGSIQGTSGSGIAYALQGIADLGEWMPLASSVVSESGARQPGIVVCQGEDGVEPCRSSESARMAGVVSDTTGFLGGVESPNSVIVGFVGQIKVKMASSSAAVLFGDQLTFDPAGSGEAVKKTDRGYVIGQALENWDPSMGQQRILVYVHPGYYEGDDLNLASKMSVDELQSQIASLAGSLSNNLDIATLSAELATVSGNLTVLGQTQLANTSIGGSLQVGLLHLDDLKGEISSLNGVIGVNGDLAVSGKVTASSVETGSLVLGAQSTGRAVLPSGQTSVVVSTPLALPSAQILLTPRTLTDKVLTVVDQQIGSFTVGIKSPESFDINFSWFILGSK